MKIMQVRTKDGKYEFPVKNKLEACQVLQNLHRLGLVCIKWQYMEVRECSQNG